MSPTNRRAKGIVQNIANQLAQMATGWEISFDGPSLIDEPDSGVIVIDVAACNSTVNGSPMDLRMVRYLNSWMDKDLARNHLNWVDLRTARVTIAYKRSATPFAQTSYEASSAAEADRDHGLFEATATIETVHVAAEATSHNSQPLLRVLRSASDGV